MDKTFKYSDNLDDIKSRYDCKIIANFNGEYIYDDRVNYLFFENTMKQLELDLKLQKLRQNVDDYNGEDLDKMEIQNKKKTIDKMMTELNNIRKESKEKTDFSQKLLTELKNNYEKNIENKEAKTIFENVSRDIVESTYKFYIQYEKKLVLIVDYINSFKL